MVSFFPQFENHLRDALKAILGEGVEKRITFLIAKDAEAIGGRSLTWSRSVWYFNAIT